MVRYLHFFSLSFYIFFLILQGGPISISDDAVTALSVVEETCKKAADMDPNLTYKFCVTSLQAIPRSHCANLRGLGLIAMKLSRTNATHTKLYIKKIMKKKKKLEPFYRSCLESCLELYSNAIYSTRDAIKYYKSRSYLEANVQFSAVMDAPSTCEDGFKEKEGLRSPLTKKNNDLFQLTALVLSIIEMLR
ncbi:hypothetical protein MKW98_024827 [Papaver atlanticum]|uniref:Pectinesterase inhibitor domain-containing protein n=1 Tax=Papaver atlanticum TaxID=357466 RepID=A0AAD4XRN2_9MAGN|nr:hypothetical protein MKW98_024827 [Papaver atlanticum]